ncbi:MAG: HlyD family efflux transporter periplasmic adaptor subunit, partial [Pseudomonadota bacterium]
GLAEGSRHPALADGVISPSVSSVTDADGRTARGLVRATINTEMSTELVAVVSELPLRPGQSFGEGDLLVAFDCARYRAERRGAAAQAETARLEVLSNEKLLKHRAIGALEVRISKAKHAEALARVEALDVRERQCSIRAPFDGAVVALHVQPHEMSKPNAPLLEVVNRQRELDLIVPSLWLTWLEIGTPFRFRIDETGATVDSRITRINAAVDPISRTVRVVGVISPTSSEQGRVAISPGMSGTAVFTRALQGGGDG